MRTPDLVTNQRRLVIQMRRARWPRHQGYAMRVGFEFVRAAVDGRQPARWAATALKPRTSRRAK